MCHIQIFHTIIHAVSISIFLTRVQRNKCRVNVKAFQTVNLSFEIHRAFRIALSRILIPMPPVKIPCMIEDSFFCTDRKGHTFIC